ncbi:MAG: hypothetical protein IPN49_16855 [Saprospiraceae bacterium]|nr:hypothetical protein [Saprospiraceae bacterium]MBK6565208.1 hypothetical protein [Saprospiraceae bacterium]MBK8080280.1 hypothetical protein [Saprospiraceae bacterium]MBK8373200.1 hypothetical protein [Saprospiraceae bacterium]MBK8820663.1 hypothetical protein [Saprospiraceae bacterium]
MDDKMKNDQKNQENDKDQNPGFLLSKEDNQVFLSVLYLDLEQISDKIEENFKSAEPQLLK